MAKLNEISNIRSGYLYARRKDEDLNNGVLYKILSIPDSDKENGIDYNKLDENVLKPIQDKYLAKSKQLIIKCKGYNNDAYLIEPNVPNNVLITSFYSIIEANEELVLPEYLLYFLNKKSTQYKLSNLSKGSSIPNLTISSLGDFEIDLPTLTKQATIARVYNLTKQEAHLTHKLADLKEKLNLEIINKI